MSDMLHRFTASATFAFCALTLARTITAEPIAVTAIAPAVTLSGGFGWAAGSWIRGARADALSTADGTTVHDGPVGGWFTSDAHANAPAIGAKGSKLTTDADTAYLGVGKSRVTFPVAVLGTKPGAAIYGYGYAAGGLSQDEKQINGAAALSVSRGGMAGTASTTFQVDLLFSLLSLDMYAPGPDGENSLDFNVEVYATTDPDPSAGDPLAPDTSFFHEELFNSSVSLTSDGRLTSSYGMLDAGLFAPASLTAAGATTSMLAPQSFSSSFQLDVPAGVDQFRIVAYSQVTDTLKAQNAPEPATYFLIGCALILGAIFTGRVRTHRQLSPCAVRFESKSHEG